tara:strand:+ start:27921 stop:28124 length:204 start_codon:yes stop_codon:yes gene_type:complete
MLNSILNLFVKYLGLPLLEKLGRFIYEKIANYLAEKKIKKEQKKKEKAIEEAKKPEDIRTAHRNNKF